MLTAAATSLAFGGFARLARAQDADKPTYTVADIRKVPYRSEVEGYGPLRNDPAALFDLPEGFRYRVISKTGEKMNDGFIVPDHCDGMGCFPIDDARVALVRNHEIYSNNQDKGAFRGKALASRIDKAKVYDHGDNGLPQPGGTTTLIYDMKRRELVSQHLSLAGSIVNCAGGQTPWGSWLTCEETLQAKGVEANADHGWIFEVPADHRGLVDPNPLKAMGRFRHEAAAVDPATGIVYLTEDMSDGFGLFYRFLPNARGSLAQGGKLQALCLKDDREFDPRNWDEAGWKQGQWKEVVWVDLDGVDNPYEDLRYRGHGKGGAWFARGEGVYFGVGELFFACTSGGYEKLGQVMRYRPSRFEGQPGEVSEPGRLQLFAESNDRTVMEMCDNIAVAPNGHLIVCEDRAGGVNFLRGITPEGKIYTIARNPRPGGDVGDTTELAGCCFSPDGSTLFLNLYEPGTTLAITGPWGRFKG